MLFRKVGKLGANFCSRQHFYGHLLDSVEVSCIVLLHPPACCGHSPPESELFASATKCFLFVEVFEVFQCN